MAGPRGVFRDALARAPRPDYDLPVTTISTRKPRAAAKPASQTPPGAGRVAAPVRPSYVLEDPEARVYVGDCREILPRLEEVRRGIVDLVFADPPFNWNRAYDKWHDSMPDAEYLEFTYRWLDLCIGALRPGGSFWVNIPDDWAAEIVVHVKKSGLLMQNWCIWHYRFGQNARERFINSKVHALYFIKPGGGHTWNPMEVLEVSDRASTYFDPRTTNKRDGMPPGKRVPLDVWYGKFWGRIQGNNKERRAYHDNQLPEAYLERVVRACSKAGDLVLDPFLGSGTTGLMAHALKRRFIGCEYSAQNAASAVERMKAGPIRIGGEAQATAIFAPRRVGPLTKKRLKKAVRGPDRTPPAP